MIMISCFVYLRAMCDCGWIVPNPLVGCKEFNEYDENIFRAIKTPEPLRREICFLANKRLHYFRYYFYNVTNISNTLIYFTVVDFQCGIRTTFKIDAPYDVSCYAVSPCVRLKDYSLILVSTCDCSVNASRSERDRYHSNTIDTVKYFLDIIKGVACYSPNVVDAIKSIDYIRLMCYNICTTTNIYASTTLLRTLCDVFRRRSIVERIIYDRSGGCVGRNRICTTRNCIHIRWADVNWHKEVEEYVEV